jgi:NADPH-dependent curcumin reductase CurA
MKKTKRSTDIAQASTITGQVAIQLAKWSGLRVIAVVNKARYCGLMQSLGAGRFK